MNNAIQRFLLEDLNIRGAIVCLGSVWQEMLTDRTYPEVARQILGEICATTLLLGQNLKQTGRLTIQLSGDGFISMLIMNCNDQLHIRGMVRSKQNNIQCQPVPKLFGRGQLVLSLDMPSMREAYQSIVPLEGDTISEIFEYYLRQSDQLPSRIFLSTSEKGILGILLQKLPNSNQTNDDDWTRINLLASTVLDASLLHFPTNDVLTRLFSSDTIRIFNPQTVRYGCHENLSKIHDMLRSLGRNEVDAILNEKGEVHITDDICNREYHFDATAIAHIFSKPENQTIH